MSISRTTVEERKALPLASGVLDYFPDALLVVAEVSRVGNEQHHPGEPLHWDKSKSTDEADALLRHLLDRGTLDTDGLRHSGKVAWRALAMLQRELDAEADFTATELEDGATFDRSAALQALGLPACGGDDLCDDSCRVTEPHGNFPFCHPGDGQPVSHEIVSEEWGAGDGDFIVEVSGRGVWPPDTRVAGRLTCCGQSEHPLDCPQWR